MRRLESHDWWSELVALKDERSLRELAEQFGVTPGAITAALRRQGITRKPAPPGPRSARKKAREDSSEGPKPRGKISQLEPLHDLMGTVPDDVVADKAGVSRRTVANYRKKHGIDGYKGKRRRRGRKSKIDAYAHLLGTQPDAAIAEMAGVSSNAVRAYRVRRGIDSWRSTRSAPDTGSDAIVADQPSTPAPAPVTRTSGEVAWRVRFVGGKDGVVVASSLGEAASSAEVAGEVQSLERLGPVLR